MEEIYTNITSALEADKQIRQKFSRNKKFFKPSPSGSIIRILPLPNETVKFAVVVREHWITSEDPVKGETRNRYFCWSSLQKGEMNTRLCPFCVAGEKIKYIAETQHLEPEEGEYLHSLIYNLSDKEYAKLGISSLIFYMNIIDRSKPLTENPVLWGCSQTTIQTGIQSTLKLWKNFTDVNTGNDIMIQRSGNNYLVVPHPPSPVTTDPVLLTTILQKRNALLDVQTPSITVDEAVRIVDDLVDLGEVWFE